MNELKTIVVRGFFWMFFAGLIVNLIQFFSKIILARILSPQEFGVVSIAISIVSFAGFFYDLGLGSALVQRKAKVEEKEEFESFNSTYFFSFSIGSLIAILLFLFSKNIAVQFNSIELETVIKIISITLPLGALTIPQIAYLSKNLLFFKKFIAETIPILLGSLSSLILAYYNWGYLSLVTGYVVGSVAYAVLLLFLSPWKPKFYFDLRTLIELISYGKFILIGNITAMVLAQGDNFVVGKISGVAQLGYYSIAYTLATLPSVNLAHIVSRVVFPTFAKLQDSKEELKIGFLKTISLISFIILPIGIGTIIVSPFIFSVIISEKWLPAHTSLIILSFLGIFKSLQVVPSFFLQATGSSKKDAKIMSLSMLVEIFLLFPLTYKFGIVGAALAVTISYAYSLINYFLECSKYLSVSFVSCIKTLLPAIIGSILMFFTGTLSINLLKNSYTFFNLLIVLSVCVLSYIITLFFINKKLFVELYNLALSFFNRNQ